MSRDAPWRTGARRVLAIATTSLLLVGAAVVGWARGAPALDMALAVALVGTAWIDPLSGRHDGRPWWCWLVEAMGRACGLTGCAVLVSAALRSGDGDWALAITFGVVTTLVATDGPWHERLRRWWDRKPAARSQDDFGPIRGRVQAWWDREPYRGSNDC
jgi:hypothetical protein